MKTKGILHRELAAAVAGMGHHDRLVVTDAGYPIPAGVDRIELALAEGLPGFLDTLRAIGAEVEVEEIILAAETEEVSPALVPAVRAVWPSAVVTFMSQAEFERAAVPCTAMVRTGEFTPYANAILISASQWTGYQEYLAQKRSVQNR